MSKRGRGGAAGAKFRISLACPVGGGHELCGQHWCKELVCDRSLRNPWTSEQTACGMQWRYGFGLCQEGKARTEEEGDACCNHPTEEDVQKKGWTVHLL